MGVPDSFVWTRFGTEAGQRIDEILERKESERIANGGTFFWGIGNAIGPSILELIRQTANPEVVFSPIRSAPRQQDVAPSSVVAWTCAEKLDGRPYKLPSRSLITSRFDPEKPRQVHYALVCGSERSLIPATTPQKLLFGELCNLLTGRPLGASQVTAVVKRARSGTTQGPEYKVSFQATLIPPYFVCLRNPEPLPSGYSEHWAEAVSELWRLGADRS